MIDHDQLRQFRSLLDNAQIILVMYGTDPSQDELAAVGALHQSLRQAGREVSLYAPSKPNNKVWSYVAENTKTEVGHQNLVISFDYSEEAVDKVSYHIGEESNKFYLTIKPKRGSEPLDTKNIEFSYTGAEADLILLVGVQQLENLDQLYFGYEDLFRNAPVVTFSAVPSSVGTTNFGAHSAALSESVVNIVKEFQLPVSPEVATQLFQGIESETNNLQSQEVTADTFEAVAYLMRNGAVRSAQKDQVSQQQQEYQVPGWKNGEAAEVEMQVVQEKKQKSQQMEQEANNKSAQYPKKSKNQKKQKNQGSNQPSEPAHSVSRK